DWYRKRFGLPDQVPFDVARAWPDTACPETAGATTSTGICAAPCWAETTSCVAVERAAPVPKAFDALTTTRTRERRSRRVSRSVRPVAPRTRAQFPPHEAQSYHW